MRASLPGEPQEGIIMKKEISREEVKYIAHLARLELKKEEEEKFTGQLREILSYIDKLKEVNTENVPPTSHLFPVKNVFREDKQKNSLPLKKALLNAPQNKRNQFVVPRIIE